MGLTTYMYAPKDDCKHRAFWRDLYSVEEAGRALGETPEVSPYLMVGWLVGCTCIEDLRHFSGISAIS